MFRNVEWGLRVGGDEACVAKRGDVRAGQVSSETRSVELKGNAACRRVCVSAALCYTECLVSQQKTAGRKKKSRHETLNTT